MFGRRFASKCCIYLLCIIFSHYVLTNCRIYISYFIRSCCECYLAVFHMSHFLPLFVKLLMFLVGFELTTLDDLLSIDSNTLPLCHGRLRTCIVICIFIFKFALTFLNSEHNCMYFNNTLYYTSSDIVHILITY